MNEKKKRILWWSDSPLCVTGFGNVARELMNQVWQDGKYHITTLGINASGEPFDQDQHPYLKGDKNDFMAGLWPAAHNGDPYGMFKVIEFLKRGRFDAIFILNDPFILQAVLPLVLKTRDELEKRFKIIFYFPIDTYPKKEWVTDVIEKVDFPVVYTEFGKQEILKINPEVKYIPVIYHGTDTQIFKPILGDARKIIRGLLFPGMPEDCFVVLNVNRNQQRKDLNRTFAAFSIFHKKFPNSFLFIHAALNDVGGNLDDIASFYGLVAGKDWSYPDPNVFTPNKGVPIEVLAQLYASVDVVVSSTLGEGWGLSVTEAMACGVPVLVPRHTSLLEIVGENEERGSFIRCGGIEENIALGQMDNGRVRPLVNVRDFADKLLNMARYRERYQKKAKVALEWVQAQTWDSKGEEWRRIFDEALKESRDEDN